MHILWTWNLTLSCLHAAERLSAARGNQDPTQAGLNPQFQSLAPQAHALDAHAARLSVDRERFWRTLLELAPQEEGVDDYVARVLQTLSRDAAQGAGLASDIRQFKSAYQAIVPDFAEQMRLRTQPLQQQWEARGPGLLHFIGRFTAPELLVESASVLLVQPVVSGFGAAHLRHNAVRLEAVLTEESPQLPEPLRLAWLLAQLDLDRPNYSQHFNLHSLPLIGSLAMLPPTLLAAQALEICDYTQSQLGLAIQRWQVRSPQHSTNALVATTMAWWETYESSRPEWPTALTALERMLAAG